MEGHRSRATSLVDRPAPTEVPPVDEPAADDLAETTLTLAAVDGIGPRRFRELVADAGSPHAALAQLRASAPTRVAAARTRLREWRRRAARAGIAHVTHDAAEYPARLRQLDDAPLALWYRGALTLTDRPAVAIVGTRRASPDGRRVAWLLAERAARLGVVVVSGLAAGIDAAAHEGAITAGGATIAVTGTGVDVPYPPANAPLLEEIAEHGLVMAESPPGARASVGVFPRRNRIIAALADLVVVVEAGHKSGALNTAAHADALSIPIAAVPGPITAAQFAGSNGLLRDGRAVIAAIEDLDILLSMALLSAGRADAASTLASSGAAATAEDEASSLDGDERRGIARRASAESTADALAATQGIGSARAARRTPASAPAARRRARSHDPALPLGDAARRVLEALARGPALVDEIVLRTGIDTPRALAGVSELELAGAVQMGLDGILRTTRQAREA